MQSGEGEKTNTHLGKTASRDKSDKALRFKVFPFPIFDIRVMLSAERIFSSNTKQPNTMHNKQIPLGFSALALCTSGLSAAGLADYDAAIDGSGFAARHTTVEVFDGSNSASFDFGTISGDATMEFIVRGDIAAGGQDGFLAVGSNATFSLRYEQWDDTGQLGFTHGGVTDYLFTPAVVSPAADTLVTYRFTVGTNTMDLFLDGNLAGSATAPGFVMPTGAGLLGNNAAGNEGMVGAISRVTTYDSALSDSEILSHGNAWTGIPEPSSLTLLCLTGLALIRRRR